MRQITRPSSPHTRPPSTSTTVSDRPPSTTPVHVHDQLPSDVSHAYSPVAVEGGRIRFLWRKRDRSKRLLPDASNGVKQGLKA